MLSHLWLADAYSLRIPLLDISKALEHCLPKEYMIHIDFRPTL